MAWLKFVVNYNVARTARTGALLTMFHLKERKKLFIKTLLAVGIYLLLITALPL